MALLLSIFGWNLFYVNQIGLFIAFALTGGGCGIWWIIEIVSSKSRAIKFNDELAQRIMMMTKSMS